MTHPLVDNLVNSGQATWIDAEGLDAFLTEDKSRLTAIFFPGHNMKKLETPDVAVVLMELLKQFDPFLRAGVLKEGEEAAAKAQCAVLMMPSLALFHGDKLLTTFAKIQDWEVYANGLQTHLSQTGLLPAAAKTGE